MSAANLTSALLAARGPHPATEALRQYAAGTLAPAEQQRIEAHSLDCERCADLLAGFAMSDAATTDRAVAALRSRLHERLRPVAAAPVASAWHWPRLAAAAAVAGLLAAGGFWGWEHRTPDQPPTVAQVAPAQPTAPPPSAAETQPDAAPSVVASPGITAIPPGSPMVASAPVAVAPARQRAVGNVVRANAELAKPAGSAELAMLDERDANMAPAMSGRAMPDGAGEAPADKAADAETAGAEVASAPPVAAAPTGAMKKNADAKAEQALAAAPAREEAAARRPEPMPPVPSLSPMPVGGKIALHEYLRREAHKFEPEPGESHVYGSVRVRVQVGEDGKIRQVKVVGNLRPDYDAEALRIVCDGPAWTPGISSGRRVPMATEVIVPF